MQSHTHLNQHLVIMLQKYLTILPSSLQNLLSRSITNYEVTWENLLQYLQQEISLQNQVNKMKLSKPSIIDISYFHNPDEHLQQNFISIIEYVKRKSTNCIKFITKAEILGIKLLVVLLEKQFVFYNCEHKKIIKVSSFRYNNVRSKLHTNVANKEKNVQNQKQVSYYSSQANYIRVNQLEERNDKVNPMSTSKRSESQMFGIKSRKSTTQTEDLRHLLVGNMKHSKKGSIHSGRSSNQKSQIIKRAITANDNTSSGLLERTTTKIRSVLPHNINFNASFTSSKHRESKERKKDLIKIRTNDTSTILKLITDNKIQTGIQTIKAYRDSIEKFQKYLHIDKNKIQKQKEITYEGKSTKMNFKTDFHKQVKQMKNKGKQLSLKKMLNQQHQNNKIGRKRYFRNFTEGNQRVNSLNRKKKGLSSSKQYFRDHKQENSNSEFHNLFQNNNTDDAFAGLQKKVLEIQSVCFYQNYMLLSFMNCELRLYSFKKTIHGFTEQLIFEKNYHSIINHVLLYKSEVRKFYNICIVLSKFSIQGESSSQNNLKNNQNIKQMNIRDTYVGHKNRQTEIIVYELSLQMKIQKQSYKTYISYSPIIVNMLPLGIGGYTESGQFFIIQLNCISKAKSEFKSIQTTLHTPHTKSKVSISSMKCHKNLVNLYIGCKHGFVYIYDLLSHNVRMHNKISNHEIRQLMFINDGNQVLFWDSNGKIGIFNSQTVTISCIIPLINKLQSNKIQTQSVYTAMMEYFIQNQYLLYGSRSIGLVSLTQNQQKKFNMEKPFKIFNRRLSLKNRQSLKKSQSIQTPAQVSVFNSELKLPNKKAIHGYFSCVQSFMLISGDGEIAVHDKNLNYIGSFFTLNYQTLVECLSCYETKYLYLLHENNDMQVVNIYTQEQLISISNVKDGVEHIFFCHSSVYFCGYLTIKKYNLIIYGYTDERYASKNSNKIQPLVQISLLSLMLQLSGKSIIDDSQQKQSKLSKISMKSRDSYGIQLDIKIQFYKGAMIIINSQKSQVLFLYKKSYTRNCAIRCQQYFHQTQQYTKLDSLNIIQICMRVQLGILSLLMSNNTIIIINLDNKSIRNIYKLDSQRLKPDRNRRKYRKQSYIQQFYQRQKQQKQKQTEKQKQKKKQIQQAKNYKYLLISHYYDYNENFVYALWREECSEKNSSDNKYIYTIYSLSQKNQIFGTAQLLRVIRQEPNLNERLDLNLAKNQKQFQKKKQANFEKWTSCPLIVAENILTQSQTKTFFNAHKVKKVENKQNQNTQKNKRNLSKSKIDKILSGIQQKSQNKKQQIQFQYIKLQLQ